MTDISTLLEELEKGGLDERLCRLGCLETGKAPEGARSRIKRAVAGFQEAFHPQDGQEVAVLSAPGRTEICGNHTDHQRGRVLAASVNLDFLSCASPNQSSVIRFQSEGWPMVEVDLKRTGIPEEEKETTASLVRGVAEGIRKLGYEVGGFDAYAISDVLPGSGLSSSAACEVLLGVIINHLFCGDALNAVQIAQIGQFAENV